MRRLWPSAAALIVAFLAACAGLRRPHASAELDDARAPDDVALRAFFTGDTAGFLAPCGCESGQYGGLARRATYLRAARRPGDLVVDLGNLVSGGGATQQAVLAYSLEGLATLRCDAFVPGEGEVRMGPAFEDAVRARGDVPVVCANLFRADDGARVFEPWRLHALRDGRVVAVVGVVEPFDGAPSAWRIAPTAEAVRAAFAELAGKADAVVLCGALREDAARALAETFPRAALVVGGWASVGSQGIVATRGAPALFVGEFAEYVGRADFDASLAARDARQAWLDDAVPDDPDAAGIVARFKAEISQEGAGFSRRLVASLRGQGYVGSKTCAECHASESAVWAASAHAHAMRTLVGKKSETDPRCIACHLGDVTPPLSDDPPESLGLGCETCHGGGARHVEAARAGSRDGAVRALARADRSACLRCHVPPNAAHFDFERDWPKIEHGVRARK